MRHFILDRLVIENIQGIHMRPAIDIYLLSKAYPKTKLSLLLRNKIARGSCINEVLALNAGYQDIVNVKIEGPEAKKVLRKLKRKVSYFDKYRKENFCTIFSL